MSEYISISHWGMILIQFNEIEGTYNSKLFVAPFWTVELK